MEAPTLAPGSATVRTRTIALLGSPNTGKSTLFNRLTGLRQKVANYPGVTVERKVGKFVFEKRTFEVIDLPGTYSLAAQSPDERVVIDALEGRFQDNKPDLLLCVLDPMQLRRQLLLIMQVAELDIPCLVCLNFWDRVTRRKIPFDLEALEEEIGVPILPVSAVTGDGLESLEQAILKGLEEPQYLKPVEWSEPVENALNILEAGAKEAGIPTSRADRIRILFDAQPALAPQLGWKPERLEPVLKRARDYLRERAIHPLAAEAVIINRRIDGILSRSVADESGFTDPATRGIDRVLTHPVAGPLAFLGLIFIVFQSVYSWAGPVMDLIDAAKGAVQDVVAPLFVATPIIQSLVVDGIIEGVGSVLIFLPQILILFFFVAVLEDTGYMARAAFLMDKMFSWCGLNGKSFVPLISSYACAIPGIMSARTIDDPKTRLTTIFIAPFMSCSARLPVYVLLIGAFVEPRFGAFWAGVALFGMHFVGLFVAAPVAWVMNRFLLKAKAQPFLLELPSYRLPRLNDIGIRLYNQGTRFVKEAGTIIFSITVIIWALLYFPRPESLPETVRTDFIADKVEAGALDASQADRFRADPSAFPELAAALESRVDSAYIEQSLMGRLGKTIQPVFAPAGFDWKITVGVVSSFPAREVIISTMGVIYSLGGDVDEESGDLRSTMADQEWPEGTRRAGQPIYTLPVVFAIMVFFALCQQCGATLAIISRELNNRWAIGSFLFMTSLAWLAAVAVFQLGTLLS